MSKYYKAEDVERLIENICNVMIGIEEPIEISLSELPAIEVSEDCISRADLLKTIDDNVSQQYRDTYETYGLDLWGLFVRIVKNAPSVIPKTDCDTCKWGEWYRNGRDITNMDDECGGCCSWNSKWTPKETETEAERLDRIDNEIEDAWARIKELTPQTDCDTNCTEKPNSLE